MTALRELLLVFIALALAGWLLSCYLAGSADGAEEKVHRFWTPAELVDAAALHASKFPKGRRRYLKYFAAHAAAPVRREFARQKLSLVLNKLSRNILITQPQEVPGTEGALLYMDVSLLRDRNDHKGVEQLLKAFDRLGELGSGEDLFREPTFYADVASVTEDEQVTEEYKHYETRYDHYGAKYYVETTRTRTKTVKGRKVVKVAFGPHLNKATAVGLAALTESQFPIFEYHWFVTNALDEPRYHELLGLDDTEASMLKLANADEDKDDDAGALTRGVVLFSEVALHNRALRRGTSRNRKGKGSVQRSFDFNTSRNRDDVMKDLLNGKAAAFEVIFTLPNGLQGYQVYDADGKRLDRAAARVALDNRNRFPDRQVGVRNCIACHLPDRGWIEVDDEVRALAAKPIKLLAESFSKTDPRRGDRIREQYLDDDFNALLQADQAVVEASVIAATKDVAGKSLTCPQAAKGVTDDIYGYKYEPVTLARLSAELGHPQDAVLAAMQTEGTDPVFVVMRAGRPGRRDQVEAGFARLAALLYLKGER